MLRDAQLKAFILKIENFLEAFWLLILLYHDKIDTDKKLKITC